VIPRRAWCLLLLMLACDFSPEPANRSSGRDACRDEEECERQPPPRTGARRPPEEPTVPAGAILLPGDLASRVRCAYEKCGGVARPCFREDVAGAVSERMGHADRCFDYRSCVRACELGWKRDPLRRGLCARTECDGRYQLGKSEFEDYRRCMLESCLGVIR